MYTRRFESRKALIFLSVPSLRGRMVPGFQSLRNRKDGPVPTGTDGSIADLKMFDTGTSRPYGDGWFFYQLRDFFPIEVPSLRGRMVPFSSGRTHRTARPVPAGTDGSQTYGWCRTHFLSRPYGDGWFQPKDHFFDWLQVPSLRGRIVPSIQKSTPRRELSLIHI